MAAGGAWPFLIGAGRVRDYRVLVAPDFLPDYGRLKDVVRPGPDGEVQSATLDTRTGRVSVTYRTRIAAVTDGQGRSIQLFYGYVFRSPEPGPVSEADFDRAAALVLPVFDTFLDDEQSFTVRSSPPTMLTDPPADPAPPGRRRGLIVTAGLVLAVAAMVGAGYAIFRPGSDVVPPPVDEPGRAAPCEGRVVLSPDGKLLAAVQGEQIVLCDAVSGRPLGPVHPGTKAVFSGDGRTVAVVSPGRVEFFATTSGEPTLPAIGEDPEDVVFDPMTGCWRLLFPDRIERWQPGAGQRGPAEVTPRGEDGPAPAPSRS
ncbi:hypothetical protein [Paractinoplanes lichenicola]|uniref:DUF4178 domain-containing protein n=1 Tax=Paractinoplanes lichenicola TaxID=2802976 RepID=A0ABS1VW35_9ACTN|nr:hypothetical protein [Actinoplanes lichenicola]MBL7258697.1 hypothetical protein [Actinoplanes lichenicola]